MTASVANITVDCRDALVVGRFWAAALGRELAEGATADFASLPPDRPGTPNWLFATVPEGKTAKNRMHVDLASPDRAAEVARLVELGATHVGDKAEWGFEWSVMADPEGNEFCVSGADGEHPA
jgi:hypothetical protein